MGLHGGVPQEPLQVVLLHGPVRTHDVHGRKGALHHRVGGVGLGQGRQKQGFLPEPENDFIFSIACEELGLIGAGLILALFVLLILRGYWIALHARDRFGSLLVVGITTLMAVQVFLNISVVTNFLPTTGVSLPFFSYGGTALMIQLIEMGIVLGVSRQIPAPKQG